VIKLEKKKEWSNLCDLLDKVSPNINLRDIWYTNAPDALNCSKK